MNILSLNTRVSGTAILWLVYVLYVAGITAPIGFAICGLCAWQYKHALEAGESDGSGEMELLASHHEWLVRTFIWTLVMAMAALGTMYYLFGFVIAAAASVWWIYRLVRGVAALIQHRAMPSSVCTKDHCYAPLAHD